MPEQYDCLFVGQVHAGIIESLETLLSLRMDLRVRVLSFHNPHKPLCTVSLRLLSYTAPGAAYRSSSPNYSQQPRYSAHFIQQLALIKLVWIGVRIGGMIQWCAM